MSAFDRRAVFQAVKQLRGGKAFTLAEVKLLDDAIDDALEAASLATPCPTGRRVSQRGIDLMHSFEGCRLNAYPDPGSRDGNPWTIGWGSTGPGIERGVTWTQTQADERFAADLNGKYGAAVDKMLGDTPTTQAQFDALTSLAYNIGVGALQKSTLMKLHKAGDHLGAARQFLRWNRNDGKIMRGLTRRRLAESELYSS